jgi:hypothetical protein
MPERSIVIQYSQTPTPPSKWSGVVLNGKWRYMPDCNELYNIESDPGQRVNVVEQNLIIAKKLRNDYISWWNGVEKTFDKFSRIVLGSEAENPVTLVGFDWLTKPTVWNQTHIKRAEPINGKWMVEIQRDGEYELELRRWPKEINVPINGIAGKDTEPINAAKARIIIKNIDMTQKIQEGSTNTVFKCRLKKGKAALQTWFIDPNEQNICGAYYVYAKRIKAPHTNLCRFSGSGSFPRQ